MYKLYFLLEALLKDCGRNRERKVIGLLLSLYLLVTEWMSNQRNNYLIIPNSKMVTIPWIDGGSAGIGFIISNCIKLRSRNNANESEGEKENH